MRRLRVSASAQRDITEAVTYIAADNPAAARQMRQRLLEAAGHLLTFPGLGAEDGHGRRHFVVPGTAFRLLYRPSQGGILILRVHHGARQWPPTAP